MIKIHRISKIIIDAVNAMENQEIDGLNNSRSEEDNETVSEKSKFSDTNSISSTDVDEDGKDRTAVEDYIIQKKYDWGSIVFIDLPSNTTLLKKIKSDPESYDPSRKKMIINPKILKENSISIITISSNKLMFDTAFAKKRIRADIDENDFLQIDEIEFTENHNSFEIWAGTKIVVEFVEEESVREIKINWQDPEITQISCF